MANSSFFSQTGSDSGTISTVQSKVDDAEAAKVAAEAARDAAEGYRDTAETHKDDASAAQSAAESARDTANNHKTAAEGFKDDAEGFKNDAAASATAAAASEGDAEDLKDDAQKIASHAEDTQYTLSDGTTTGYSSLHYAAKAEDHKIAAETAETNAETAEADAVTAKNDAVTAKNEAVTAKNEAVTAKNNAETAEANAETAEANAETAQAAAETARDTAQDHRDDAEKIASHAEDSQYTLADGTTTGYSALHYKEKAADSATAAASSASTATTQANTATTQAGTATTKATEASNSASSAATAQTAAEAARDSALAALDSFDDRFLGSKSSAPTVDNDGDALVSGALYFDTTDDAMKVYSGSQWLNAYASLSGALIANQNLSDLNNVATARTNLGLAAVASSGNLTDLGITDGTNGQALKTDGAGNFSFGDVATSMAWSDITSKPTTISGFGITDAFDGSYSSLTGKPSGAGYVDQATGGFGTVKVDDDRSVSWAGYAIRDDFVFMSSGAEEVGIYNDTDNEWMLYAQRGGETRLYYDGSNKINTYASGVQISGTAVISGGIDLNANLDMCGDASTSTRFIHLPRNGGISFYGDNSTSHSITSRNLSGTPTDDLCISSYGAVYVKLDANNNNTSAASFIISKNNETTSMFKVDGENGNTTINGNTVWHAGNDGTGSGLDADTLDGQQASAFTSSDHFKWRGTSNLTSTTTSALMTELNNRDCFDSYVSAFKTSWSYAGNADLTDAGRFTEMAGTSWLTWTDSSTDGSTGNFTALAIAPNTGGSAGKVFIYNDQGSSYNPGWREVWTSASDGAGSGLDADKLDGYDSAENGADKVLRTTGNGYLNLQSWVNVGSSGIYSSTTNGAHFTPNTSTSYGTWKTTGSRGGYDGICFNSGGNAQIMFDSGGNGGIYRNTGGRWYAYHHYNNNCLAIGGSTTSVAYELYVHGDIYATGNVTAYSDARAKENVETIDGALGIVEQLRGVYYNKIDNPDKTREIGFIAQEVNAVEGASELVTYAEDVDQYSVSYGNTAALLVEAVKELSQEVKTLKAEIEELKKG